MSREFYESIEQEKEWRETLQRNKEALQDSAIFLQLWSDGISRDPLACLQLGLCIMIDKPIHIACPEGTVLPENMQRLARSVEYFKRDDQKDLARAAEKICKNAGLGEL